MIENLRKIIREKSVTVLQSNLGLKEDQLEEAIRISGETIADKIDALVSENGDALFIQNGEDEKGSLIGDISACISRALSNKLGILAEQADRITGMLIPRLMKEIFELLEEKPAAAQDLHASAA